MDQRFDMVKKRAVQKRQELEQDPTMPNEIWRCMQITDKFLSNPNCFTVNLPIGSLAVLKFLGYPENKIKDLYFQLVYEQSTGDQYRYVDPECID